MPNGKRVFVVAKNRELRSRALWGSSVGTADSVGQAVRQLGERRGGIAECTVELAVVQYSLVRSSRSGEVPVEPFRHLLGALRSVPRLRTVLVVDDEGAQPDQYLSRLGRDYGLDVRYLHVAISSQLIGSPPGQRFSHLLIGEIKELKEGLRVPRSVGLIESVAAECGHHKWEMRRTPGCGLGDELSETRDTGLNGPLWWRLAAERGKALERALLDLRCGNKPCSGARSTDCRLKQFLAGKSPFCGNKDGSEETGGADYPLVAVAYGQPDVLLPIELLPCQDGEQGYQPLYKSRPVMHQLASHGPPCYSADREAAPNYLLVCANDHRKAARPLYGAEREVNNLRARLAPNGPGARGANVKVVFSEKRPFEEVLEELADEHDHTTWDVVHWAGHAWKDGASARYAWPIKGAPDAFLEQEEMEKFLGEIQPQLVHFSCCDVGATDAMARFARIGVPYVLAHRWPIRDDYAPAFSESFYVDWLFRGLHPSVALFQTRRRFPHYPLSASSVLLGGSGDYSEREELA